MFFVFLILIPNSLAKDLPETKHLRGGVFGWANALTSQRKIWSSLSVPMISFDSSEISLSDITTEFITSQIDINLSQIIQDMLGSLFNETEEDNITDSFNYTEDNNIFSYKKQYKKVNTYLPRKSSKYNDEDGFYYPEDEENKTRYYCDKDLYPNAHLITDMFEGELEFNCEVVNNFMGQLFSYVFIIAPLLIIFIICILYYIVFCFGRCCCCRAKHRFNPGIVSIIFFIIITTFLIITICFSFTASAYLMKIINYIFKKELQKDAETVCQMIDPSISNGLENMVNKLVPSIERISNDTISTIDESLPQLMSILNGTQNNIESLLNVMQDLQKYGSEVQLDIKEKENVFNQCIKTNNGNCPTDQISEVNFFDKFSDFSKAIDSSNDIESAILNVSEVMNVSSFIDSGKETIVNSINGISDSVNEIGNFSIMNKCDFNEMFEFVDEIPSFIVPLSGVALFLIPAIMLIILLIQVCVFWTKGCCSRCCVACCIPCCFCAFFQLFMGLMATFSLFAVIFINLFYNQGDDVVDTFIKGITNDERTIDFGSLNLSSITNNVIGSFPLDSIKLKKIEFIKNLIDAKLDTPLSKIVSLEQMPFNEIADMIEMSLTNAANSTNLDDLIVTPIRDIINDTKTSLPDVELNDIAQIDQMNDSLNDLKSAVDQCYQSCNDNFNNLNKSYFDFFAEFHLKQINFANTIKNVEISLDVTPNNVSTYAYDLFGGLLKTLGKSFASTLRLIVPVINEFNVRWAIGTFNIFRVNIMYNILVSMACISITSHLYMVGMMAMTTLLWCRRKGMAKEESSSQKEEETSCSSSSSNENNKTNNNNNNNNNNLTKTNSFSFKRQKVSGYNNQNNDNVNNSSGRMKNRGFGRMRVENYTNNNSESDEMSSIDGNKNDEKNNGGINLYNDQENPKECNYVNPYEQPYVNREVSINAFIDNQIDQQQISAEEAMAKENENQDNGQINKENDDFNNNQQQQQKENDNFSNNQQQKAGNDNFSNNQQQQTDNDNFSNNQQQQAGNDNFSNNQQQQQTDNDNFSNNQQQQTDNDNFSYNQQQQTENKTQQQQSPIENNHLNDNQQQQLSGDNNVCYNNEQNLNNNDKEKQELVIENDNQFIHETDEGQKFSESDSEDNDVEVEDDKSSN